MSRKFDPVSGEGLVIVGAGLAGMIAGSAWPRARIVEASAEPQEHRALLRFRSDEVARLTGTEFRKVLVRKGLWVDGRPAEPCIALANQYAQKVLGSTAIPGDRSIWNLVPVERFVAPEGWVGDLRSSLEGRVTYGETFDYVAASQGWREHKPGQVVSTAPMFVPLCELDLLKDRTERPQFEHSRIRVHRWRLPGADLFQTIYFPHSETAVYRASFTGETLIVESVSYRPESWTLEEVVAAFGFDGSAVGHFEPMPVVNQKYGKIRPLEEKLRRNLMFELSAQHGIHSLGRFATWRNILLDDVVQDINKLKRLMRSASAYDLRMAAI